MNSVKPILNSGFTEGQYWGRTSEVLQSTFLIWVMPSKIAPTDHPIVEGKRSSYGRQFCLRTVQSQFVLLLTWNLFSLWPPTHSGPTLLMFEDDCLIPSSLSSSSQHPSFPGLAFSQLLNIILWGTQPPVPASNTFKSLSLVGGMGGLLDTCPLICKINAWTRRSLWFQFKYKRQDRQVKNGFWLAAFNAP